VLGLKNINLIVLWVLFDGFDISISKSSRSTQKGTNLMPFPAKHSLAKHSFGIRVVPNVAQKRVYLCFLFMLRMLNKRN
jgi:hypothetical protein